MANFKVKNGLQAGRYLQTGGTETAWTGPAYDIANASYDGISLSVAAQATNPTGMFFKTDGTKLYIVGYSGRYVSEYNLSTAWDVSTSVYSQNFSVFAQDSGPSGMFFKPDGTKMYIVGNAGEDVHEYNLSIAWDISTSVYSQSFSVTAQDTNPRHVFFKSDGTKMYIVGNVGDDVNEYNLSIAWDVSTSVYSQNFSVATQETSPLGIFFKPDGTKMYVVGVVGDDVNEYGLSTAWDVSTASYLQNFSVAGQETVPYCVFFKTDGTKMYVVGGANDTVYQYSTIDYTQTLDLSTGTYFSFTLSVPTTVSFTNAPASGKAIGFSVEINGDGSAITWPTSVKWPSGVAPTATATKEVYAFVTTDGGTSYYGKLAGSDIA